jgi:competence protein ComEA
LSEPDLFPSPSSSASSAPLPAPLAPPTWLERVDRIASALGIDRRRVLVAGGVIAAAVVVLAAVVASRAMVSRPQAPTELSLPRASRDAAGSGPASSVGGPVVVAAAGAVVHPGVYRVTSGARVIDVVQAAGGPTPDADVDRVNLAAKVADGERVYLPRKGEAVVDLASNGSAAASAPSIIDLNTATLEQLDALPGVGPATAQAIVDYRTQHGRFRRVDDLLEVRGIGEAKLAQLRPRVRVS